MSVSVFMTKSNTKSSPADSLRTNNAKSNINVGILVCNREQAIQQSSNVSLFLNQKSNDKQKILEWAK